MNMKANELMIGDWVRINNVPMQIQSIDSIDDEIYAGDELYCLVEDRVHSEDKIEPIPLTAEILEKNGFIRQQFNHFRYENEDNDLVMAFYPKEINYTGGGYDYIDIYKGRMTLREIPISYVHELQHALKLCGIDKEIVL